MKCPRTRTGRCNRFVLIAAAAAAGVLAPLTFTPRALAQEHGPADVIHEAREGERDAAYAEAELAASRRVLDQAIARADTTAKLIATLRQESQSHAERIGKLNTGDEGKRLASTLDPLTAGDVAKMLATPAVDAARLAANQKQADDVLRQLKAQREQVVAGYVPPQDLIGELDGLLTWAREQRSKVRDQGEWLDQQLSAAPKDLDLSKAPTLHDVVVDFQRRDAAAREKARLQGAEDAQNEGRAAIGEAARTAELERLIQQANLHLEQTRASLEVEKGEAAARLKKQLDDEAQRLADLNKQLAQNRGERALQDAKARADEEKARQEAALVAKRQQAAAPRVGEVLAPFLSAGYMQPSGKITLDQGPVSFSQLRKSGALERSERGLVALIKVATSSRDKQRPRWGLKTTTLSHLTPAQLEMVKEAQQDLIHYGDVLVEQGKLAK